MGVLDTMGRLMARAVREGVSPEVAARAAREGYVPRTDLTTPAYHGSQNVFGAFQMPPLKMGELDRSLGIHAAKDPTVASTFADRNIYYDKQYPTESFLYDPLGKPAVYPLWIPSESKMLQAYQPLDPRTGAPVMTDTRSIATMMGTEAFKKDRDLLERWLRSRSMPPSAAKAAADEMFRGGRAQIGTFGEGGRQDITDAVRYADPNAAFRMMPNERQLISDLARQSWLDQGYKGIKYINTSPGEVKKAADPTSYIVFKPSDIRARPAARMDAAKMDSADLLAGLAAGGVVAGSTLATPNQAQAAPQFPFRPTSTIADALASLAGRDAKNKASPDALRVPEPPARPPMPPRPAAAPSAFTPMPANPAAPPQWLTQHLMPHLSNPATYQPLPPPSMVPNAAGKLIDPNSDPRWQGAAADLANLASYGIGVF